MDAFITRKLRLRRDDVELDIPVRLFWPTVNEESWDCRWEIDWPDRQRASSAGGFDAIQALLQALTMIGAEVYCSDEHRSGRLSWGPDWVGYGFPIMGNLRDLLIGDDAKFL
jgi:hypothetical protein